MQIKGFLDRALVTIQQLEVCVRERQVAHIGTQTAPDATDDWSSGMLEGVILRLSDTRASYQYSHTSTSGFQPLGKSWGGRFLSDDTVDYIHARHN